ncbi:hypothetical protein ACL03H_22465 [Saccharopolyspora sp. MS10]|uniref:hypothetical protein n=1 Tax=Saccharopolyspora sp. MS10 TaxID=3385973 RepID=UPI0039A172DB
MASTPSREVPVKGYSVHLLFHALALICGAAVGIGGALWWSGGIPVAGWAAGAALLLGVAVLVLQWHQLTAGRSQPAPPPNRGGTRPEFAASTARGLPEVDPPTRRG